MIPILRPRPTSAFSGIELLAVLVLLIVLSSLYYGSVTGRKQRSRKAVCAQNLQKLYVSLSIYATENEGNFPSVLKAQTSAEALSPLVPKFTSETSSFNCPGTGKSGDFPAQRFASQKIGYSYYMGVSINHSNAVLMSDCQVDTASKTNGQPIFSGTGKPPGNNHKQSGGMLLFSDGEVQSIGTNAPFPILLRPGLVLLNP